jgi:predicted ATPase/transcriptional regulator with XRE-family HTH domain
MMDFAPPFGTWLKQRRKRLGMTQNDLAQHVRYSLATVRKIEAGKLHPSREMAAALAECLAVAPEDRAVFIEFARGVEPRRHLHSLPASATTLIGRDEDAAYIRHLLARDDPSTPSAGQAVRLLTLVGPPGVGKTRLALHAARELQSSFTHGACFVSLAPIADPQLVPSAIAIALGVRERPEQPVLEDVKQYLSPKQLLLALDNFEHLLEAAAVVAELLGVAPRLKVIATSRAPLRLSAEHLFDVLPLSLPPATELFTQRAQAVKPGFALTDANRSAVSDICNRVDRLPLAIELAAARVRQWTPQTLLAKLSPSPLRGDGRGEGLALLTGGGRDLPQRQQTLRDTIEWSYRLLTADEQRLLRHLGVFVGGAEAEQIAHATPLPAGEGEGVRASLESLIDKNLLRAEEQPDGALRYSLLELIREFALEQLTAHGELAMAQRRHAEAFAALAEQSWVPLRDHRQQQWIKRLQRENANVEAALKWSFGPDGDAAVGCHLVSRIQLLWRVASSHSADLLHWTHLAEKVLTSDIQPHMRGGVLLARATLDVTLTMQERLQAFQLSLACYVAAKTHLVSPS